MRMCAFRSMFVAAGILALSVAAFAQDPTLSLSGVVTDSTGQPVAGAKVLALRPGPGNNTDVVTDARGQYQVPVLLGDWLVTVEMDGFATQRKQFRVSDEQIDSAGPEGLTLDFALSPADAVVDFTPARTPDGQVDISGYWADDHATGDMIFYNIETGNRSVEHYIGRGTEPMRDPEHAIVSNPDGKIPYQPWAVAERDHRLSVYQDPPSADYIAARSKCWLPGTPGFAGNNPRIIQTPDYVIMSIEFTHGYRIIPLDGRPHVGSKIQLMNGDSRGRWEGNSLVVDVTNMKGGWIDLVGNFRTDAAKVVERWTPTSPTQLRYEATITDPEAYTEPMTVVFNFNKRDDPDYEFYENACHEGNAAFTRIMVRPAEQ